MSSPDYLSRPTISASCNFSVRGQFRDEDTARRTLMQVREILIEASRHLDGERLEEVIIDTNYDAALANVDRGVPGLTPSTRSTEHARGVAMAITVLRTDVPKSCLVIDGCFAQELLESDPARSRVVLNTLVHELAHVADLKVKDRAFPGFFLRHRYRNDFEALLTNTAMACADEYYACNLSASLNPDHVTLYEATFVDALTQAATQFDKALGEWLSPDDMPRAMPIIIRWMGHLLKSASYLIGHLDGLNSDLSKSAPRAAALLQQHPHFCSTYNELDDALAKVFANYGHWSWLGVYDPLRVVYLTALRRIGLIVDKPPPSATALVVTRLY